MFNSTSVDLIDCWLTLFDSFGAAAFMLETIPFGSLASSYTNLVGAALWASDLEKKE